MKYLIDAQLPKRLSDTLNTKGYDSIHTHDLPDKNRTKDRDIISISLSDQRIVVSKDSDFVDSILLLAKPFKLLFISTGNIPNDKLLHLFMANIESIDQAFNSNDLIELTPDSLIIHQ